MPVPVPLVAAPPPGGGGSGGGSTPPVGLTPVYRLYTATGSLDWAANVTDEFGVDWVVEDCEGWTDSPDVRKSDAERAHDHGDLLGPAFWSPRTVRLAGRAVAPDRVGMLEAKDRLHAAAGDLTREVPLVVEEAHLTRRCLVRREGAHKARDVGSRVFEFEIVLKATDPFRYSDTETVLTTGLPSGTGGRAYPRAYPLAWGSAGAGGTISAVLGGTQEVRPLIRFTGPVTNPRVDSLTIGEVVALQMDVPAGSYVDVDCAARTVLLDGTSPRRSAVLPGVRWITLRPGTSDLTYRASGYQAASLMTVRYRAAW